MCEMLVRIVDKDMSGDPALDYQRTRRGDVIVICPDNWPWSQEERTAPIWKIIKIPNVSVEAMESFITPTPDSGIPGQLRWRRAFSFNVTAWQAAGEQELTAIEAHAFRSIKPDPVDPNIIGAGTDPNVLG